MSIAYTYITNRILAGVIENLVQAPTPGNIVTLDESTIKYTT